MFELSLWMILALPLLGSVVIAGVGRRWFAEQCHMPCIGGAIGAFLFAALAFIGVAADRSIATGSDIPWINAGDFAANLSLRADGLTAVMIVMVTFIGSLIAIYSAGYMKGDPGYPRFFAVVSLFLFF